MRTAERVGARFSAFVQMGRGKFLPSLHKLAIFFSDVIDAILGDARELRSFSEPSFWIELNNILFRRNGTLRGGWSRRVELAFD